MKNTTLTEAEAKRIGRPELAGQIVQIDKINTTQFPRIETNYEHAIGVIERAGNPQQARIRFEQALRARGYAPAGNGTWFRDGYAAVMVP